MIPSAITEEYFTSARKEPLDTTKQIVLTKNKVINTDQHVVLMQIVCIFNTVKNLLILSNNLSPLVFNCGNWPPLNPIWGCAGGPDAVNLDRSLDYNDPVQRKRCVELCLKHMATDQDKYGCCFLMGSGGSGCYYKARSTADPGIGNGISISCRLGKIKLEMF